VNGQGEIVRLKIGRTKSFNGFPDPLVEHPAPGANELAVRDGTSPVVSELEVLTDSLQHPPSHKFLDACRSESLVDSRCCQQQGEVELASDHGSHGRDLTRRLAEPVQAAGDQLSHAL